MAHGCSHPILYERTVHIDIITNFRTGSSMQISQNPFLELKNCLFLFCTGRAKKRNFEGQFWLLDASGGFTGGYELFIREIRHPYGTFHENSWSLFWKIEKNPWGAFRRAEILAFLGNFMDNWGDPYWLAFYWQIMGFGGIINGLLFYKQIIGFWERSTQGILGKINKRGVSER